MVSLALLAQLAVAAWATPARVVYRSEDVVVYKDYVGSLLVLTSFDPGAEGGQPTCRVTYPAYIGARPETLHTAPVSAAVVCHTQLPKIRKRLMKNPMVKHQTLMTKAVLEMKFITDEEVKEEYVKRGWPRPSDKKLHDTLCFVWPTENEPNTVYCRTEIWMDPSARQFYPSAFAHEIVHLAFKDRNVKTWLNESLADYVAFTLGYSTSGNYPRCQRGSVSHYTEGYNCGAALLSFAETHYGLDLEGLAQEIQGGKEFTSPEKLDQVFRYHILKKPFDPPKGTAIETLWRLCLDVPAKLPPGWRGGGCKLVGE